MCVLEVEEVFSCWIEERISRFTVRVNRDGRSYLAHNTNTGRLEGLLTKGRKGLCRPLKNPMKTSFRLFAVETEGGFAVIDTHLQEIAFRNAIEKGEISFLRGCSVMRKNPKVKRSTFDFLLGCGGKDLIVETKSAVLKSEDGFGMYPDCPTKRGRKHIEELMNLAKSGYHTLLLFIVAIPNAKGFKLYREGDIKLYDLLQGVLPQNMRIKAIGMEFNSCKGCVQIYSEDLEIYL